VGAGTQANFGTRAYSINAAGEIAGWLSDDNGFTHDFVRDGAGNITTFDGPDAIYTAATSINDSGISLGIWEAGNIEQGFLRDAAGNFTSFSVPVPKVYTSPTSINDSGRITGWYGERKGQAHGFIATF
jgi:hypothetical protein